MSDLKTYFSSLKNIPNLNIDNLKKCYEQEKCIGIRFNVKKLVENGLINKENLIDNLKQFLKTNNINGTIKQISWCKNGFYYQGDDKPGKNILHELGAYYLQEPSAMAPVEFLDINENDLVLDLCASPGGKSTQIAEKLENGFLVANEIVPSRAKTLTENIQRLGFDNVVVLNHSPKDLENNFKNFFDKILVDAPCSGEGMFRKNDNAINEWNEDTPKICAKRQKEIVDSAIKMLAPNGKMVYSTCTFSLEENEEIIKYILDKYSDIKILPIQHEKFNIEKGIDIDATGRLVNCARLYPYKIHGEGHFFAVLQRQNLKENDNVKYNTNIKFSKKTEKNRSFSQNNNKNVQIFKDFAKMIYKKDYQNFVSFGENLYANCNINIDNLKVVCAGVKLGEIKKNIFVPSWHLAHTLSNTQFKNIIELQYNDVQKYLQGLEINTTSGDGWALLTYCNLPFAFGKCVSGKIKNHYPKSLRKII